jgi:hypothetical protein
VFGGDGATLCAPVSFREKIEAALAGTRIMAEISFGFSIRVGIVDMTTISKAGHRVMVGKFQPHAHYQQAMFKGSGLAFAESLVKAPPPNATHISENHPNPVADFSGFECRWNEVGNPDGETVALLVKARADGPAADEIYGGIMKYVFDVYGKAEQHHPLREDRLSLTHSIGNLLTEVRVKHGSEPFPKRLKILLGLLVNGIGGTWFINKKIKTATADWGKYKASLIANTDFRKFDGALRMIISGNADQRLTLRDLLEKMRAEGRIAFGLHANPKTLITCIISNYQNDHAHFVDGSNGGYAMAAEEFKNQLKAAANV